MGLDVILYINVVPHQCPFKVTLERPRIFEQRSGDDWIQTELTDVCKCYNFEKNLVPIRTGELSVLDSHHVPGESVRFLTKDGFHFGPYIEWIQFAKKCELLSNMSFCDGMYSGIFLVQLCNALKDYLATQSTNTNINPKIVEYYELLETWRPELLNCLLVHC